MTRSIVQIHVVVDYLRKQSRPVPAMGRLIPVSK